jgi:hypothetical protein
MAWHYMFRPIMVIIKCFKFGSYKEAAVFAIICIDNVLLSVY